VFTLSPDSLHISTSTVEALLVDTKTTVKYKLEISGLADNTFRFISFISY